jgi:hypothetical protein
MTRMLRQPGLIVVTAILLELLAKSSIESGRIMQKHWLFQRSTSSENLTSLDASIKRTSSFGSMKRVASGKSLYRSLSNNSLNRARWNSDLQQQQQQQQQSSLSEPLQTSASCSHVAAMTDGPTTLMGTITKNDDIL